jgi:hypothetical protein
MRSKTTLRNKSGISTIAVAVSFLLSPLTVSADFIDNDIALGTLGHWSVDVTEGGESRTAWLTANRFATGDVSDENVLYDYFTYIDTGSGGVRLSASATYSNLTDDTYTSGGSFVGSTGNTINWTAVSSIADGDTVMYTNFSFEAAQGALGDIRLFQYMDEDIQGYSDDVFFTRGSVAGGDLELYTVDNVEVYGVSHSGAFSDAQGLVDSFFSGWAVCQFDEMKPAITAGTQSVSTDGLFCDNVVGPFTHPQVGTAYGPQDIVSVLAWDVNSAAASSTIITSLGGVVDVSDIPVPVPEPATLALMGLGLAGIGFARKRKPS